MKNEAHECLTFNSPLEAGIRSVGLLVASYPKCFDIQQLVVFDYLVVHTGDINGPESLHPQIPLRSTELLVRRKLVENGLLLMMSRKLVVRQACSEGILYQAGEMAETFYVVSDFSIFVGTKKTFYLGYKSLWIYELRSFKKNHSRIF
jgi:hypothetical protein